MKKFKRLPAILALMLCVGMLAVGIYALQPAESSLEGTVVIENNNTPISIGVYIDDTNRAPVVVYPEVRYGIQIKLDDFLDGESILKFDSQTSNTLDEVPPRKVILRITNLAEDKKLGGYYLKKELAQGGVITTQDKVYDTTNSSRALANVTLPSYTVLSANNSTGTVATATSDFVIQFNMASWEAGEGKFKYYLNVEEYDSNIETEYEDLTGSVIIEGTENVQGVSTLSAIALSAGSTVSSTNVVGIDASHNKAVVVEGVTDIAANAFSNKTDLITVVLPNTVTTIGDSAFSGCTNLAVPTIPTSLTSIGNNAFSGCGSITEIRFPASTTEIGTGVFADCEDLTKIVIEKGNNNITFAYTLPATDADHKWVLNTYTDCPAGTAIAMSKTITNIYEVVDAPNLRFAYNGEDLGDEVKVAGSSVQLGYNINSAFDNEEIKYEVISGNATVTESGLVNITSGQVVIRVSSVNDNSIYKDITLNKVENPEFDIKVDGVSVVGQTIKVNAGETAPDVKVEFADSEIIDANEVAPSLASEAGLTANLVNEGNGVYSISHTSNKNKPMVSALSVSVGETTKSVSFKFNVLQSITLDLDNNDDKNFGLACERVFGTRSYIDGSVKNYLPASYLDKTLTSTVVGEYEGPLYWFSSNTSVATVNSTTGNLDFVNPNTAKTTVQITVGDEDDLEKCSVTDTYTFTIVNGLNVETADAYSYCTTNNINVVLMNNIQTNNNLHDGAAGIFGNGYTVNYNNFTQQSGSDEKIKVNFYGDIRNVTLKGGNDGTVYNYPKVLFGRNNVSIYYSRIENFNEGVSFNSGTHYVENSCFVNCIDAGVVLTDAYPTNSGGVYVKNCIFENVGDAAISYSGGKVYIEGFLHVNNYKGASQYGSYTSSMFKDIINNNAEYFNNEEFNAAIISIKALTGNLMENVYFKNGDSYTANSDTACTGLGYSKLSESMLLGAYKVNIWTIKYNAEYLANFSSYYSLLKAK